MKKSLFLAVVTLAVVAVFVMLLASCSSCSKGRQKEPPMFDRQDTATVVRLTEEYLNRVKAGEYDAAIGMLHHILSDSVRELPAEREAAIREQYKAFPVLDYELTDMKFINPHRVRMTYSVVFFEKPEGSSIPNTITLNFEPQRVNGEWYLELSERNRGDKRLSDKNFN